MSMLKMDGIYKSFGGVKALVNVEIEVAKGEVHAVVGENGAGKSTLMKILAGAFKADQGIIKVDGVEQNFNNPKDSSDAGVSCIYQELNMAPHLSVAENIFLDDLPMKRGIIDWKKMYKETEEVLKRLETNISPKASVRSLSVAQQQMVEMAKSLKNNSKIVIFDEPSAVLGKKDSEVLFSIIAKLKSEGVSIIYISHRLDEILRITDKVTVLKDGTYVKTVDSKGLKMNEIVSLMTGQQYTDMWPERQQTEDNEIALEVNNLNRVPLLRNISFNVRKGEVLGLAGLVGSGRSELARCIFGIDKIDSGEFKIFGEKVTISSPQKAIAYKIAFVTEDRKNEGLLLKKPIYENITLTNLKKYVKWFWVNKKHEMDNSKELQKRLSIKTNDLTNPVNSLSGGNQQKVVLAKWLNINPDILILDEPTRGVDVGAKSEIYQIIEDLKRQGKAIIVISSEFSEIVGLSDRIFVMDRGEKAGEYSREEALKSPDFLEVLGDGGKI